MLDPMPRRDLSLPPRHPEAETIGRLRALLCRCHGVMTRANQSTATDDEWNALIADLEKAVQ